MRFGIKTIDEFALQGKTVLIRVDMNQPVDMETGKLKSTARIKACAPTVKELAEKGAKVVVLAHQGSDIEYQNFYTTEPHREVLEGFVGRPVQFIPDVCGPAAIEKIKSLQSGDILLLSSEQGQYSVRSGGLMRLGPPPRCPHGREATCCAPTEGCLPGSLSQIPPVFRCWCPREALP